MIAGFGLVTGLGVGGYELNKDADTTVSVDTIHSSPQKKDNDKPVSSEVLAGDAGIKNVDSVSDFAKKFLNKPEILPETETLVHSALKKAYPMALRWDSTDYPNIRDFLSTLAAGQLYYIDSSEMSVYRLDVPPDIDRDGIEQKTLLFQVDKATDMIETGGSLHRGILAGSITGLSPAEVADQMHESEQFVNSVDDIMHSLQGSRGQGVSRATTRVWVTDAVRQLQSFKEKYQQSEDLLHMDARGAKQMDDLINALMTSF